jgi:hypothetical protein
LAQWLQDKPLGSQGRFEMILTNFPNLVELELEIGLKSEEQVSHLCQIVSNSPITSITTLVCKFYAIAKVNQDHLKCLIKEMGQKWPHIKNLSIYLKEFYQPVENFYRDILPSFPMINSLTLRHCPASGILDPMLSINPDLKSFCFKGNHLTSFKDLHDILLQYPSLERLTLLNFGGDASDSWFSNEELSYPTLTHLSITIRDFPHLDFDQPEQSSEVFMKCISSFPSLKTLIIKIKHHAKTIHFQRLVDTISERCSKLENLSLSSLSNDFGEFPLNRIDLPCLKRLSLSPVKLWSSAVRTFVNRYIQHPKGKLEYLYLVQMADEVDEDIRSIFQEVTADNYDIFWSYKVERPFFV